MSVSSKKHLRLFDKQKKMRNKKSKLRTLYVFLLIIIYNRKSCKAKETELMNVNSKQSESLSDDLDLDIIPKKFKYGKKEASGKCRNNELLNKGIYFFIMYNNISCNVHFMNIGVRGTSVPSHHPSLNDNLKSHNSSHHKNK